MRRIVRFVSVMFVFGMLLVVNLFAVVEPASSVEVLIAHSTWDATIIRIDVNTGAATLIGPTGFIGAGSGLTTSGGVVIGPDGPIPAGTVFGLFRDGTLHKDFVVTIDIFTGRAYKIVEAETTSGRRGISFGPDGTTLYVVHSSSLSTVDISTGVITLIGPTTDGVETYASWSLELDPDTGFFYAFTWGGLIKIDPITAETTFVVDVETNIWAFCHMARSPSTGLWYWTQHWWYFGRFWAHLYTIDVTSGTIGKWHHVGRLGPEWFAGVCGSTFVTIKTVSIDVNPGASLNHLNCKSGTGVVPVSIATEPDFDALDIDVSTLRLENQPVREKHMKVHKTNSDGDGDHDALLHLQKSDVCEVAKDFPLNESVPVTLTGYTIDGIAFMGETTIRVVAR